MARYRDRHLDGHLRPGSVWCDRDLGRRALVVGYTRGSTTWGTSDMLAIRLNGAGDTLWTRAYGGGFLGGLAFDAAQTADGGFILCGDRDGNGTLVRLDTNGDLLWARSYGTAFNGDGLVAVVALSDGFAACGRIQDRARTSRTPC